MNIYLKNNGKSIILCDSDSNLSVNLFSIDSNDIYCCHSPNQLVNTFNSLIKSYPDVVKYTYGQTTLLDIIAMVSLLFQKFISGKYRNVKMLEVGSWFGCSTIFNAKTLKFFSPDNVLFAMDTWKGSPNESQHEIANYENAFEHFRAVLRWADVDEQVKPLVSNSLTGMEVLRDNCFDIVFIDAAHNYKNVCSDILNAIKLIRPGGLILGHDCECKFEELPMNVVEAMDKEDPRVQDGYHVGVIKALHDIFGNDYEHFEPSLIWHKTVTAKDKKRLLGAEKDKNTKKILSNMCADICETIDKLDINAVIKKQSEQLLLSLNKVNCLITFMDSESIFNRLENRKIKSMTSTLKDYLTSVCAGIYLDKNNVSKKYIVKSKEYLPIWKKTLLQEINNSFDF